MKASKSIIPNRAADVRPLDQRETKLNTRKGMIKQKCNTTNYHDQLQLPYSMLYPDNPYLLTGEELERTVEMRKQGR